MSFRNLSILALTGAASTVFAGVANAGVIVIPVVPIDSFVDAGDASLQLPIGTFGSQTFPSDALTPANAIFSTRTGTIEINQNDQGTALNYVVAGGNELLTVSADSGTGGIVTLDYTLPFDGATADLTVGGNVGDLGLLIPATDLPFTYDLTVFDTVTSGTVGGSAPFGIPDFNPPQFDTFGFDDFGGVDFTEVTRAILTINAPQNVDLAIDFFGGVIIEEHNPDGVPEPTSLVVLGLGALGAFAVKRRNA
ncbi:MAG: PEP-CTERM sorting domain-containing protein [Cyanobacteria bacterium P01_H01_bin.15]